MEPENKKPGKFSFGRVLVLCAAFAVFFYSGIQMFSYLTENHTNDKEQQELIDQAVVVLPPKENRPELPQMATEATGDATGEATEPEIVFTETAPIYVDFAKLQEQNPDIIGWIYSPDTKINYPIVQGESNQEYLHLTHTRQKNSNGSIFMDFRNLPDFSDFNNIIYGHNMNNGAMFGTLKNYRKQAYFEEHPTMWILTPDKAFRIDLISAMVTPSDSETYELFSYVEDLQERMEYAVSHSTFDAGEVDISQIQKVVTLSTCTYEYATARYVVIGTMTEVGYPEAPTMPETTEP